MPPTWTTEQILALAPDAGAAKAGKDLAVARKWLTLGHDAEVAWGTCQGSGVAPYQTGIDLTGPGFRCSCPSRKFPCKHALGLFLLLANAPQSFTETARPEWITAWLAGRARREATAGKAEGRPKTGANPAARARSTADRTARVAAGLQDLDLWMTDLVRHGLAAFDGRANASPLARRVWMHCGDERETLQDWCQRSGQFEFAQLARAVFECEPGDPVAARLLQEATQALEDLALAIDPRGRLPLVVAGSIGERLAPRMRPALRSRLVAAQAGAAEGALVLARRLLEQTEEAL